MALYTFLDWFFIVFHTTWTIFNLTGWWWRRTRKIHLITTGLTAFSWFVCGWFYGWGYCICTDWHWQVRDILGKENSSYSFIHYAIRGVTGLNPDPFAVDILVLTAFLITSVLSITLNIIDYRKGLWRK
ncbi:MAG TPA: DUF2784 domain-containing protein [Spirochaetota bacterium]|nr:DUF2784 domain-containing protein [Spirochaetota bacterium]